jgi:hypothetical protein
MLIPLTFIAAAVATQAAPPAAPPQGSNPIEVLGPRRFYGPPFLSPMGEPFRQRVPHDDPLADWFHQADRNHDGYLTADEMVLDADRFFAVLDLDHNGVIDPEEIENYEQVIAPEVRGEPLELQQQPKPSDDDGGRGTVDASGDLDTGPQQYATRIRGGGNGDRSNTGAGQFSLFAIPEPVTGADLDLSGRVTLDEFRRTAVIRFNLLDSDQKGRLTLEQLERMR